LEKDRNRRYETANGFAMDVQRYLADEPVQACPPSMGYLLKKFVRRNKAGLVVGGAVAGALLLAVVVLVVANIQIAEALGAKTHALGEAEQAQTGLRKTLGELGDEKRRTEQLYNEERRTTYHHLLSMSDHSWWINEIPRAEAELEQCPPEYRGWEWHYLR